MDINYILLLVAVLNLSADLYNIMRFRAAVPRWILWVNVLALATCGIAWLALPLYSGYIGAGALLAYVTVVKTYSRRRTPSERLPSIATKFLIGANIAAYLIQLNHGAADNPVKFIELGAVYSPLLAQGEWWRIFSAQFLHWGGIHLAFNMMGLWVLGRSVEALIGPWGYLVLYLLCGAGGMLIAWGTSLVSPDTHPIILLGASASVLGLVGTQAAISLVAYRYTGSRVAKAQLSAMMQIVLLQAVFDMMVPEVSSTAHIGGAAVGFCVSYVFVRRRVRTALLKRSQEEGTEP